MADAKKATLYLQPQVFQAVKMKAAQTDQSLSGVVNDALERSFAEDYADIRTLRGRAGGRVESYESFLRGLKSDGTI